VTYETILYEVTDHVAVITFNRPEKMNAVSVQMIQEFIAAVDRLDADDEVRCVIVTGAGRQFCAGADLSRGADAYAWKRWKDESDGGLNEGRNGGGSFAMRIYNSPKPFIAAINGSAVGFGLTLTLPMDVRICAETAKLGFVFSRRGVVIDAASGWFLPRAVPMTWATEWAYSGRMFSPQEALRAGLVRDVLPAAEVLPAARRIAAGIAEASPVSVATSKALLWRASAAPTPWDAFHLDYAALADLAHGPDAAEGAKAFLEKRDAKFIGRVSTDMPGVYPWWDEAPPPAPPRRRKATKD